MENEGKEISKDELKAALQPECPLDNPELIEACRKWVSKLCSSKGNDWCLSIPPDFRRDPDLLLLAMAARLEEADKVIDFYQSDAGWEESETTHLGPAFGKICEDDMSENPSDIMYNHRGGGKRARAYKRKYGE